MSARSSLKGFLIDLDGTVVEGDKLIPGAAETLAWLKEQGIPYRFVTNTTSKPREAILKKLMGLGLQVSAEEVITAPIIARDYLLSENLTRCYPLIKESLQEDLQGIDLVQTSPQAVVVGDIGDELSYERLNRAFRFILEGAAFIALAQNRYFKGTDGLCLDVGSIVAALEYATDKKSRLIGKPSADFFTLAGQSLGIPQELIGVIGDDLEADVMGGKGVGSQGLLVKTGKFRPGQLETPRHQPDVVLESLAALPEWYMSGG